jgi:ubiquinone/menaquinone biosynthesis C-methylase UbiE
MEKKSAQNFYNTLSADYDSMINFDASILKRKEALKNFISAEDETAADLGCGSGLDSIALSQLGLKVTGFDISEDMINAAAGNAARYKADAEFHAFPMNHIPKQFNNKFSLAVSLGNSIANIEKKKLIPSLARMHSVLKPGGHILIQILNYERILAAKERIVGITQKENSTFIRFYDFEKERTFFNILKIEKTEKIQHALITTEIFPYKSAALIKLVKDAGFKKVQKYGGLNRSDYIAGQSPDLVLSAYK